jgi:hypothetical protein
MPRRADWNDPTIQQLVAAAARVERAVYGFSPLPTDGDLRVEFRSSGRYDAMLHLTGRTSRTIAFRKRGDGYVWIGEQETFEGPSSYTTVDGTFQEAITLTFETEVVSGVPLNSLNIRYHGDDPGIAKSGLVLSAVNPVLQRWGFGNR